MAAKNPIASLRKIFGPVVHTSPEPSQGDVDAKERAKVEAAVVQPEELPEAPQVQAATGLVLMPSVRIDGSSADPPWTIAEPILWDMMRNAEIKSVETNGADGLNGIFWAKYANNDGNLSSALLRFDGINREHVYRLWGTEYVLDPEKFDLLRREQASYEVAKACGMEDIVAPLAVREVDPAALIPSASRKAIANEMGIAIEQVDGQAGPVAILQALPKSSDNFVEHWGTLGPDSVNRWGRATDRLRHSLYRAIALDFLLGTGDRTLASLFYNRTLDSVVVYDLSLSFPHPGYTAEKYLQFRADGWGRKPVSPIEDATDPLPPHSCALSHLSRYIQEDLEYECVRTFNQISDAFTDELAHLTGRIMVETGVHPAGIAGFFARVAFMSADPETVLRKPGEFVKNVLVPMRRGYGFAEGRNQHVVQYVASAMSALEIKKFDFPKQIQEPISPGTTFYV